MKESLKTATCRALEHSDYQFKFKNKVFAFKYKEPI